MSLFIRLIDIRINSIFDNKQNAEKVLQQIDFKLKKGIVTERAYSSDMMEAVALYRLKVDLLSV
tara:strand:- start:700 stop:891 length:192 start_codon:yes stop_codon:yes gene_type:complete